MITKPKHIIMNICYVGLLVSSLLSRVKFTYFSSFNLSIHYLLLPLFSTVLIFSDIKTLKEFCIFNKKVLVAIGLLYIWIWICTFFSNFPTTALTYTLKYSNYFLIFIAFLRLNFTQPKNIKYYCLTLLVLIQVIAILGWVEIFFPKMWMFRLFKYPSFHPQIGSIMQNPNQFGVLMAIGASLTLILYQKKIISTIYLYISELLLVISVAISTSRNAWLVFILGLVLLRGTKIINNIKFISLSFLLIICILLYPAANYKLGFMNPNLFPSFELLNQNFTNQNFLKAKIANPQTTINLVSQKQSHPSSIETKISNPQTTALSRLALWKAAIIEMTKQPITGIGIGVFAEHIGKQVFGVKGFHAHNIFLNIGTELGIPGLLMFIGFLLKIASDLKPSNFVTVPILLFLASQMLDFFIEDYTFTTIELYFLSLAVISGTNVEPMLK
ncbi:O-antigen ligase family protein [Coleofasciculus sp. F4-SAH-05]|uniref:O-antigen ligase family protein n=1 Tax=Coleofasciculus sp. F4-SAH-05 TaxID=3069525 RepID=UPI00330201D6